MGNPTFNVTTGDPSLDPYLKLQNPGLTPFGPQPNPPLGPQTPATPPISDFPVIGPDGQVIPGGGGPASTSTPPVNTTPSINGGRLSTTPPRNLTDPTGTFTQTAPIPAGGTKNADGSTTYAGTPVKNPDGSTYYVTKPPAATVGSTTNIAYDQASFSSGPDATLSGAILKQMQAGMSGQQLVDWLNANGFPGAAWYPGVGEKGVYGLPGSYISFDNGQWHVVTRGAEGGAGTLAMSGAGGPGGAGGAAVGGISPAAGPGASTLSPVGTGSTSSDPNQNALFKLLMDRATQSLKVDPNDPIIRGQVDAYGASQERARRNYLSGVAEQAGPVANISAERRHSAEQVGQATSAFQAQALQTELTARRQEIQQALTGAQGMLTSEQQNALQLELAQINDALQRASLQQQFQEFGSSLGETNRSALADELLRRQGLQQNAYQYDQTRLDTQAGF